MLGVILVIWSAQNLEARKYVFGVGETFVFLRNLFFVIVLSVTLGHRQAARLDSARLGSALLPKVLPKVGVWCRRDNIFPKKLAFGVDETTFDF